MIIAILDSNECNFAVKFNDESQKEKVIEYMKGGLDSWYGTSCDEIEDNKYFTAEEIEGFFQLGYAEPTEELLVRNGIEAEVIDVEYDDDGKVINADKVIWY